MSPSLYCVVEEGNKAGESPCDKMWKFRIAGIDEVIGYMQEPMKGNIIWDGIVFCVDEKERAIVLNPTAGPGECPVMACCEAFSELCQQNRGWNKNFDEWLGKPPESRKLYPIHTTMAQWQKLAIPAPMRGIFGMVTIGVHLNIYSTLISNGLEQIDHIWVSHRAMGDDICYSGMLDQVVAGGMELTDLIDGLLNPIATLKREANEEAGLILDLGTNIMTIDNSGQKTMVGTVKHVSTVSFYDRKNYKAGRGNEDHLEPGVRYIYDLKLEDPKFQLQPKEPSIERFEPFTVDQVKSHLREQRWKPNCGLVMLDFLIRNRLITSANDERCTDIEAELRKSLPFESAQEMLRFLSP